MPHDPHFNVSADATANLLSIQLLGDLDQAGMHACVDLIKNLLQTLRPGFAILTDLSLVQSMDIGCIPEIERMMDLCRKNKVGRVVRVIPDSQKDIGFNILSLFHYPAQVHIVTHQTLAEARHILAQPPMGP